MKKIKILSVILSLMVFLGSFAACSFTSGSTHVCESVCEVCGGCIDADCTEEVCKEKCECEEVTPPTHACQNKCEACEKCKNAACAEEVCKNKCDCKPDQYELNIMSFNIRWPTAEDKEYRDWDVRKMALVSFLNDSGADVIGLQEITAKKNQLSYIQENLIEKYEIIYFGDDVTNATIYNSEVFELVSQEQYYLSETPDVPSLGWNANCYLAADILMLEHKATGETVRVINTHGALDDDSNVKGFELIAQRSLSGENDPFTIMTGDFNATPNKLGYVPIAEKLQDCRYAAKESPNREHNTYNGWGKYPDEELSRRIIDYCFVSKGENVEVLSYQVRNDKWLDGKYISDHYAVQTTVRISNVND